ncbi:hypothetical protein PtA15_12A223 [Puccinia triticina]|uniref:pyridoxal 5'-phosphate synthase n=1 Tax=Puccinia triticina TaxID=208348 RepID=A0ABY7D1L1_9BASI|nr:uncharacterized protein PtA15_12A223 [Puccinia triticina]WAQ90236.1 hypothetical protein PtA15_12A223 [Puccinia triticina]WAR61542.1 hypothetical protein PtB15_12B232 [Puccinia triticina]
MLRTIGWRTARRTRLYQPTLARMTSTEITSHQQYHSAGLTEHDLDPEPMAVFKRWFDEAQRSGKVAEPEAMCVSTVGPTGVPSARFVLLKKFDAAGFVFFTHYGSRKAAELAANPGVALAFYWGAIHQQVRVVGRAAPVAALESDQYFAGRPPGSRVGAWASPQSSPIVDRAQLLDAVAQHEQRFRLLPGSIDRDPPSAQDSQALIPRPPHWGGYRIVPHEIEFWVGRPNRLHDRFVYRRNPDDPHPAWTRERLAP